MAINDQFSIDNIDLIELSDTGLVLETTKKAPPKAKEEETVPAEDTETFTVDEEVVEEEVKEKTPPAKERDSSSPESKPFRAFAKAFLQEGVISDYNEEEFEDSFDGIKGLVQEEINHRVEEALKYFTESLPEELQEVLLNYQEGVPANESLALARDQAKFTSLKEDDIKGDVSLQKSLVERFYKETSKFSDEKIRKLISRSEDLDELQEEAMTAFTELSKLFKERNEEARLKAEKVRKEQEANAQKYVTGVKSYLQGAKELIPGVKLDAKVKARVHDVIFKPAGTDGGGRNLNEINLIREKNPVAFDTMLAYLYVAGIFTLDKDNNPAPDWSKVTGKAKSDAVKELEEALSSSQQLRPGGRTSLSPKDPGVQENLDSMRSFLAKK